MPNRSLYSVESHNGCVVLRFHTSRRAWLIAALLVTAFFTGIFLFGVKMGWPGAVLSGLFGGCTSLTLVMWFAVASHLMRYTVFIEEEIVALRPEFYGIPVARRTLFPRRTITDLGTYPCDPHGGRRCPGQIGSLCFWTNGKSIQLEPYFPIPVGMALAQDLRKMGIEFPRTYAQISLEQLQRGNFQYQSF